MHQAVALAIATALAISVNQPTAEQIAWELGSKLGLAALGQAQGAPQKSIDSVFNKAILARAIGARLPSLPKKQGTATDRKVAALHYLLDDTGKPIGGRLKAKHGQAAADLFEISLKSYMLLMLYAPGDKMGITLADVIQKRAQRASLPADVCSDLVEKVRSKASYAEVKAAQLQMY